MEETIEMREVLDWMDAGQIFSLKFYQFDEKRPRNNGKSHYYFEAVMLTADQDDNLEKKPKQDRNPYLIQEISKKVNPNHNVFFTRNIRPCIGKRPIAKIIKIHIDLVTQFNGRKVILP